MFAVHTMKNFHADVEDISDDIRNTIWGKIVPGVGTTLVTGNTYYTWMGIRLTNKRTSLHGPTGRIKYTPSICIYF
jgi:hypothetical protein